VTLPSPVAFRRGEYLVYFVVFTTTPRSPSLAQEIAADATISVSLLRQITINEPVSLPPTPPHTPSVSSEELEPSILGRNRILKRVVKGARFVHTSEDATDKPLPETPTTTTTVSHCRKLSASMCIGFPKRPRHRSGPEGHPVESHASLPDGLCKGKMQLDKDMLPSIEWAGVIAKV
jgi:hypothetical protein